MTGFILLFSNNLTTIKYIYKKQNIKKQMNIKVHLFFMLSAKGIKNIENYYSQQCIYVWVEY